MEYNEQLALITGDSWQTCWVFPVGFVPGGGVVATWLSQNFYRNTHVFKKACSSRSSIKVSMAALALL